MRAVHVLTCVARLQQKPVAPATEARDLSRSARSKHPDLTLQLLRVARLRRPPTFHINRQLITASLAPGGRCDQCLLQRCRQPSAVPKVLRSKCVHHLHHILRRIRLGRRCWSHHARIAALFRVCFRPGRWYCMRFSVVHLRLVCRRLLCLVCVCVRIVIVRQRLPSFALNDCLVRPGLAPRQDFLTPRARASSQACRRTLWASLILFWRSRRVCLLFSLRL